MAPKIAQMSQMARPMVTNNLRRVLLGATESHSVPMPVEMKKAGYDCTRIRDAGYEAGEANDAGYTVAQMFEAGYEARGLKAAGHTAKVLRECGYQLGALMGAVLHYLLMRDTPAQQ